MDAIREAQADNPPNCPPFAHMPWPRPVLPCRKAHTQTHLVPHFHGANIPPALHHGAAALAARNKGQLWLDLVQPLRNSAVEGDGGQLPSLCSEAKAGLPSQGQPL